MVVKDLLFIHFGNFVSGQVKENTRDSIILNLTITKKGTGEVVIDSAEYTPIYTYKGNTNLKRYKVLNIKKALDAYDSGNGYISSEDYTLLKKEYEKIINTVGTVNGDGGNWQEICQ